MCTIMLTSACCKSDKNLLLLEQKQRKEKIFFVAENEWLLPASSDCDGFGGKARTERVSDRSQILACLRRTKEGETLQ